MKNVMDHIIGNRIAIPPLHFKEKMFLNRARVLSPDRTELHRLCHGHSLFTANARDIICADLVLMT